MHGVGVVRDGRDIVQIPRVDTSITIRKSLEHGVSGLGIQKKVNTTVIIETLIDSNIIYIIRLMREQPRKGRRKRGANDYKGKHKLVLELVA